MFLIETDSYIPQHMSIRWIKMWEIMRGTSSNKSSTGMIVPQLVDLPDQNPNISGEITF